MGYLLHVHGQLDDVHPRAVSIDSNHGQVAVVDGNVCEERIEVSIGATETGETGCMLSEGTAVSSLTFGNGVVVAQVGHVGGRQVDALDMLRLPFL